MTIVNIREPNHNRMAYQTLLMETKENVLHITLNRAEKMNALNLQLISELDQVFDEVYADNDIHGVLITGSGDKAFAAGADIAEFANFNAEEGAAMAQDGHHAFNKIEACPKPVIALVNGFALGGGCELAMACHIRIATENAQFGQPEVNLGILPGYGGTQRLIQLVGKGKAMELLMTGDMVNAQEAHRIGLANHVLPAEEAQAFAEKMLQKITRKGPLAIAKVIDCVEAYFDKDKDGFAREIEQFGRSFDTLDFKEGTQAFLEKRKPNFNRQ